jgi:ABC-2 type transport system permease protein
MRSIWLVMTAEYLRLVRRRSFVFATLGVPALIALVIGIAVIASGNERDPRPIGVVDRAGIAAAAGAAAANSGGGEVGVQGFADEDAARRALTAGTIQAYYVIAPDYQQSHTVQLRYLEKAPSAAAHRTLDHYLRGLLVNQGDAASLPPAARTVLQNGPQLRYRALGEGRVQGDEGIVGTLLPFVVGFLFIMVVMSSGGYMLQAVTTEKENRMIEVLFTSLSPLQLVAGKTLGLIGVAFTQLLIWLLALVIGMTIAAGQVDFLANAIIKWDVILVVLLYFIPTYALVAGIMITLGSMVSELQYAQQISGLINLLFIFPLFVLIVVFTHPNSPLIVALTLFPTTTMMMIAMRWGVAPIPVWQLGVSMALLVAAALFSIWVAARVFRAGMLRYGQPINLAGMIGMLKVRPGEG